MFLTGFLGYINEAFDIDGWGGNGTGDGGAADRDAVKDRGTGLGSGEWCSCERAYLGGQEPRCCPGGNSHRRVRRVGEAEG